VLPRVVPIFLLAVATTAGAENLPVSVRATGADFLEAHTRQAVTFVLSVAHGGPQARTLILEPLLPPGWKVLTQEGPFVLAPSTTDLHMVSFLVPSRAAAGEYAVAYRVKDLDDPTRSAACDLKVSVLPEVSLDLKLMERPSFVIAGKEYTASFILFNNGNTDVEVDIDVTSGSLFPFKILGLAGAAETAVPAGGIQEFSIEVRTDPLLVKSMLHPLQVTARLHPAEDAEAMGPGGPLAIAASSVEVVPLSVDARVLSHKVPVVTETTITNGYDQGVTAGLEEAVRAQGTLDEAGAHRVDLELRKRVDTTFDPLFNPTDRYSFQYESRYGELGLGDLLYTVSPLLASDVFGRGIRGMVNLAPFRFGAQYYKDVWSPQEEQAVGGTVDFTIPRSGNWDDVLYRAGLSVISPLADRISFGLMQQYNPKENLQFQLDTAIQDDPSGAFRPAVFAWSQGKLDPVSWTARFVRAWPDFQGTFSDTQSLLTLVHVRLLAGSLTLHGGFSLTDANLLMDPAQLSADRTMEISLGTEGEIPGWGMRLRLDWENWRRVDRLPTPRYDSWENIFRLSLRQPFAPFAIGLTSSASFEFDKVNEISSLEQQHNLSFEYQPANTSWYAIALLYNGRLDSNRYASHVLGWQVDARYSPAKTQLEAKAGNSYIFSQAGFTELLATVGAKLTTAFSWGSTLTAQLDTGLTYDPESWAPYYSLQVTYGMPFDLPVGRKPGTATVTGRVYNAATDEPMAGVLLRLDGLAALSDAKGRFTFYLPQSGTKYIQVDMATVGPDMVPAEPMPREVTAPSGSTVSVAIGMVKSCSVTGSVGVYGFPDEAGAYLPLDQNGSGAESGETSRARLGGLGNVIVEITNGTETRRKLTGPNGDFSFLDVRPGDYVLRIAGGQIPSYHKVEPGSFDLALTGGESRSVEFRVVQEQRGIKILEDGASIELKAQPGVPGGATIILKQGSDGPSRPTDHPQ
jgi:hypothetical protein